MEGIAFIPISDASQPAEARRIALRMAEALSYPETARGNLAIIVTEAATNLLKHGGGGQIILREANPGSLEVIAFDNGPGMRNVADCLRDGYSTAGSPGTGLGAMHRLSESLEIHSVEGGGTVLTALCLARPSTPSRPEPAPLWDYAALVSPVRGEELSGDCAAVRARSAHTIQILVADGLGHGPLAADASQAARQVFEETQGPPKLLIERMHEAMRSTRGAAVAIAEIDRAAGTVRYCGVGNIGGSILGENVQHMVSMNGIVGHQAIRTREFEYAWRPGSLLAMYSDGISSRWQWSSYAALRHRKASLVAATLFRDHRKTTDDSTVVILREPVER